ILSLIPRPPVSTLFPYTTLFRSNKAREHGLSIIAYEGEDSGEWVLVDLGDIVVHCMQPAIRQYYNLEEIWGGKPVRVKLLPQSRSEEHTSELQSRENLVCRLLLE